MTSSPYRLLLVAWGNRMAYPDAVLSEKTPNDKAHQCSWRSIWLDRAILAHDAGTYSLEMSSKRQ